MVAARRWRAWVVAAVVVAAVSGAPSTGAAAPPPGPTMPLPTLGGTFGTSGSGTLVYPWDVGIGPDGSVYVADTGNNRIVRFDGDTGAYLGAFGVGGPSPSTLAGPHGLDVDPTGDVWVADRENHRIKRFSATGTWEATIGSQGSGAGQFSFPRDVTVVGDEVFVADTSNDRVQVLARDGVHLRTIGGASGPSKPVAANAVDVGRDGTVFVTTLNRVAVFEPDGTYYGYWDSWPGSQAGSFLSPRNLDVDRAGHVVVPDESGDAVHVFGPDGYLLGRWGSGMGLEIAVPRAVALGRGRAYVLSAPTGFPARVSRLELCPTASFTDLPRSSAFFDAVCWAVSTGVVQGYADGGFHPTDAVSRQAAAAFLWRVAGSPAGPFPDPGFPDVPVGHPFRTPIAWLKASGITGGYADGTFRPTAPVSRQAMASYLYDFVEATAEPVPASFSDVPTGHPFFDPIGWLAATGISTGYPDGTFRPTAPVSRQAMVQFLAEVDGRFLHQPT